MKQPPPLAERQKPGLSKTLPFIPTPGRCSSCGQSPERVQVWLECNEWDEETRPAVHVILCDRCSSRLIEPHPRLYKSQDPDAPNLGAMALCAECPHRSDLSCTCQLAKQNGGPGMEIRYDSPPTRAHVRGSGFSGFRWFFKGPPSHCAGRAAALEAWQPCATCNGAGRHICAQDRQCYGPP
jgi:hypothetical protein